MFSPTSPLCTPFCAPRFPWLAAELLKEWVLNIGRATSSPSSTQSSAPSTSAECFSAFGNRKNLKHNAVPTVFAFQGPPQVHGRGGPQLEVGWALLCHLLGVSRKLKTVRPLGPKPRAPAWTQALGNLQFKAA